MANYPQDLTHCPPITTVGTRHATSKKLGIRSEELGMFASQMDNALNFLISRFLVHRDALRAYAAYGCSWHWLLLLFILHFSLFIVSTPVRFARPPIFPLRFKQGDRIALRMV
jgi:hypothetical protein